MKLRLIEYTVKFRPPTTKYKIEIRKFGLFWINARDYISYIRPDDHRLGMGKVRSNNDYPILDNAKSAFEEVKEWEIEYKKQKKQKNKKTIIDSFNSGNEKDIFLDKV